MSFFSHFGKASDSYVLQLHIHDVSPISSFEALHCVVKRSSKEFHTRMAMGDGRACSWEETIRMISTLYRAKSKDKKATFDKKEYTFIVQTDRASKQRSSLSVSANAVANAASASHAAASAAAAQNSKSILMSVDIDLAAFAVPEHLGTEVTRSFALKAMKGGGDGGAAAAGLTPMLKVTFKVSLVKKGEAIPSMSKSALATVDEQQKHFSASPIQANSTIDSYSKQAGDHLSPDLARRPRRINESDAGNEENDDEPNEMSSRRPQHTPTGSHGEEDLDAGSKPRRSTGDSNQKKAASSPRAADGAQSYASGVAEDVMTPPSASLPAPAPSQTDTVSDQPPSGRRPSAMMSPAERKRRSDTQIFTAIMTNELSSPIADDKPPPLSRRASHLNPPQSAPAQPDSPAVLARSPSAKHASLRVSTSNADIAGSNKKELKSAASARPTPATADDGAFTSYADGFDDDDVPSPEQLRQQQRGSSHGAVAADAHADDNDDAVAPSSFADRHSELTVDDVLSPFGHSGAPSRPASTAGGHARLPSMFVTKSSDRNAVTKLFSSSNKNNYSRTADSALALPKKGSSNDKDKTGSGGRGSFIGSSSGDSQPPSASSARTPQLTAAASFTGPMSFASLSDPALMKKMTSKRESAPAPEHERSISGASRSRHSIDEMLDGNHLVTGGHSQHNSRQASRSPSPSRSTGSSGGTAGSSVGSSLPSYISGTFLPAASPRQNSKPSFPHSSPAKHSAAHVVSRVNGRSPFSSLSKEESRMLSTGGASASSTMSSAGGSEAEAEAGSLASYRAAMKQQKMRSSSRSNNSTPYSSLQLPVVADHGVGSASKTLPLRVSSSGGINVAPPSPRSAGSRGLATGSLGRDASAALSRSNPTPITAAEATKLERDFFMRMRGSVDLLCDQLQIPDLFDAEQPASAGAAAASAKDSSPSPASSPNPAAAANPSGTPLKSMWSSVKARLASPSSNASSSGPTRSSGASTPVTPSAPPSPAGPQAKAPPADPFFHGVPVWSCLVVRCLHAWDAFAVSTFAAADPSSKSQSSSSGNDEASSAITRSAGRSWILSAILAHLHKTGLFLCARSAAGQRQNALCFFIAQLATLIQLVEGFSRSSMAPAPYPLLDDGPASPSSDAPAPSGPEAHTARYAQALRVPSMPDGFSSWRGIYVVAQLPHESTHRVSEWARAQIKALGGPGQGVAGKGAGSAPQPSPAATASNSSLFPYSLSLGVSTYSWFLAHLRALLCTVYQCLLELVLTELEIVDPASILAAVDDPMADSVGYEHTLEQLIATYHKIGDDALRNCLSFPLRTHLFASLFAHLNSVLFNAVLGRMNLMNMTTGMRLKVITKSMQEWARGFGDDGHGAAEGGAAGDKDASRESALLRVCNSELEMCNQLSLLLLMDKRGLTLNDLSAQCSALTPVSLYHLLLNYLPVSSAAAASAAGAPPSARSSSDLICDSILDELSTYQTDVLSHLAARSSGPGPRVLFPAWRVAGLRSRRLDVSDDDEEDDGRSELAYGAHLRAQSASVPSTSDANIQSPFLAPMQHIPLPRSAVAASSASAAPAAAGAKSSAASPSRTSLLPLSSVPVPTALLQEGSGAFACLQRQDQLVLPITRGVSTSH